LRDPSKNLSVGARPSTAKLFTGEANNNHRTASWR
jgi:hypothetical protein